MITPPFQSFLAYLMFISALVAATRTDLEAMVIPELFTIWLIPFGIFFSYAGLTNITTLGSVMGTCIGYGLLWFVARGFKFFTGKDGMGVGDMELLAMIGSFLGPIGVWLSVMLASLLGLIIGSLYLAISGKDRTSRIPFGPFLALGAVMYFFFDIWLIENFLGL